MRCAWCRRPLEDVHGHGACLNGGCPMFGLNQAECCSGEQAEDGWVATSDLAAGPGDGAGSPAAGCGSGGATGGERDEAGTGAPASPGAAPVRRDAGAAPPPAVRPDRSAD